jgi:hypothetical protein
MRCDAQHAEPEDPEQLSPEIVRGHAKMALPASLGPHPMDSLSSIDVYEATPSPVRRRFSKDSTRPRTGASTSSVPSLFYREQQDVELDLPSGLKLLALHNPKLFDDIGHRNSMFRQIVTHDTEFSEHINVRAPPVLSSQRLSWVKTACLLCIPHSC